MKRRKATIVRKVNKKCECGRTLCDFCEENAATGEMVNQVNGNRMNICKQCYQELWGDRK